MCTADSKLTLCKRSFQRYSGHGPGLERRRRVSQLAYGRYRTVPLCQIQAALQKALELVFPFGEHDFVNRRFDSHQSTHAAAAYDRRWEKADEQAVQNLLFQETC